MPNHQEGIWRRRISSGGSAVKIDSEWPSPPVDMRRREVPECFSSSVWVSQRSHPELRRMGSSRKLETQHERLGKDLKQSGEEKKLRIRLGAEVLSLT